MIMEVGYGQHKVERGWIRQTEEFRPRNTIIRIGGHKMRWEDKIKEGKRWFLLTQVEQRKTCCPNEFARF